MCENELLYLEKVGEDEVSSDSYRRLLDVSIIVFGADTCCRGAYADTTMSCIDHLSVIVAISDCQYLHMEILLR